MPTFFLQTARLHLRPFTPADADNLLALDSDPEVMRYINGGRATPRETIEARILPNLIRHRPGIKAPAFWAAEERTTDTFLGWFEFRPLVDDSPREIELGYRLNRSAWGKGYATEGCRALIRKGFTDMGVERVTANTMTVNRRSRRVMEKCGLTYARTFFGDWPTPIEGSTQGEVEYDLTREAWEQSETGHTTD